MAFKINNYTQTSLISVNTVDLLSYSIIWGSESLLYRPGNILGNTFEELQNIQNGSPAAAATHDITYLHGAQLLFGS